VLGMTEVEEPPVLAARGGYWLRGGGLELHLGMEDPFVPAGKAHPGLEVTGLRALAERFEAAGVPSAGTARSRASTGSPRRTRSATGSGTSNVTLPDGMGATGETLRRVTLQPRREVLMNTGLLLLRLVLGLLLVGHGSQKLFGSFGGHGLDGTGGFFDTIGFRPGRQMAFIAGISEVGGGALLALGLLTPLASAVVIGTLVVAGSVHLAKGVWGQDGGYELPLLYVVGAASLAFTGPGRWSVDHAAGLDSFAGNGWGLAALVLGALGGAVVVVRARRARSVEQEREPVAA